MNPKKRLVLIIGIVGVVMAGLAVMVTTAVIGVFVFMTQVENSSQNIAKSLPKEVPQNQSAQEYYELGIQYKQAGWTEQAREALKLAITKDKGGETGKKAEQYLYSKLPKYEVPQEAVQRNIQGYNQWHNGDFHDAEETFRSIIAEYPNFEWPYANLARMYVEQGKPEEAGPLLDKALEINPQYLNAWLHYASLYELKGDKEGKLRCLRKALDIAPDDPNVLKQIKEGEES